MIATASEQMSIITNDASVLKDRTRKLERRELRNLATVTALTKHAKDLIRYGKELWSRRLVKAATSFLLVEYSSLFVLTRQVIEDNHAFYSAKTLSLCQFKTSQKDSLLRLQ